MGPRMRQDRVGRVAHERPHRDDVEIERARRVARAAHAAMRRLDGLQRGEQRLRRRLPDQCATAFT